MRSLNKNPILANHGSLSIQVAVLGKLYHRVALLLLECSNFQKSVQNGGRVASEERQKDIFPVPDTQTEKHQIFQVPGQRAMVFKETGGYETL